MLCQDCRAKCCAIYNVEIQEAEIPAISELLNISVQEFKLKCLHVARCNNSACKKTHYCTNTKLIGKEEYCWFVDENTFQCTIYGLRPAVCSRFRCARYLEELDKQQGHSVPSLAPLMPRTF